MSAPNFYVKNATKHFVVEPYTDEDGEYLEDGMQDAANDTTDNVFFELKNTFPSITKMNDRDNERNYSGRTFARISEHKKIAGIDCYVTIALIIRSAYYVGATLDWELNFECEGYDSEVEPDISDFVYYAEDYIGKGMAVMQYKNANKFFEKAASKLTEAVENVYGQLTRKMVCTARFSNGEAMYQDV